MYAYYDDFLKFGAVAVFVATYAICHVPFVVKALNCRQARTFGNSRNKYQEEATILKEAVNAHKNLKYVVAENYWGFIEAWKKCTTKANSAKKYMPNPNIYIQRITEILLQTIIQKVIGAQPIPP